MRGGDGFALVAALWLLVGISAAALEIGLDGRQRRLTVIHAVERTQSRAAARAGLEHARAVLQRLLTEAGPPEARAGQPDPWSGVALLMQDTVRLDGEAYHVTLRDAASRLDLNRATEEELRRLLRAAGVDFGLADRVAQAALDWRDPDDEHRGRGAERAAYLEAGRAFLPRNGPFRSVDELRHVLGVDRRTWERVAPHLTTRGGGRVNVNSASAEVLAALPGMTPEAVAVVMRHRRGRTRLGSLTELSRELSPPAQQELRSAMLTLVGRTTFATDAVEVLVDGWGSTAAHPVRGHAIVSRRGSDAVVSWRSVR